MEAWPLLFWLKAGHHYFLGFLAVWGLVVINLKENLRIIKNVVVYIVRSLNSNFSRKRYTANTIINYSEIFLKSTVKRATKECNLFCKTGAKRVEWQCCTFYHLRKKPCNLICYKTGSNVCGKTRNIFIQLVLQQCFKTSCTFFFVARFTVA